MSVAGKIKRRLSRIVERKLNQRHCYDYGSKPQLFSKYPVPVIGNPEMGTMFDPFAVKFGNGVRLFVSSRRQGTVDCFYSENSTSWNLVGNALRPGEPDEWDPVVNRACVVKDNTGWKMWYTGQRGNRSAIGIASSIDGATFERVFERPVLTAEESYEGVSVMNPCVIWNSEKELFYMWYSAGEDYEPDVICLAESSDGVNWKKNGVVIKPSDVGVDCFKVGGCHVVETAEYGYLCFYIGYQNVDVARVCLAISERPEGPWIKFSGNPLLAPTKEGWDAHAVYKPTVLVDDSGRISLWYNGRRNRTEYIGFAECRSIEKFKTRLSGCASACVDSL